MANSAVQVKQQADSVRGALQAMIPQFKMALPRHLTPERLLRVTMTAVQNTPALLDCDRRSLFAAVMSCAQLGLEPDGVMGQAYLVPFKGKVQLIVGYKGYLALARNSGEIASITAHEVCANDEFDYAYGLQETLHHVPAEGERGPITHFYAYAKFKDGGYIFEVMTLAEVEKIRDGSEGYKAFKAGKIKSNPWDSHFVQMGRKTVIRRLANYLPMSVQKAARMDDAHDEGQSASLDDFGDLVIDHETGEVIEDGQGDKKPTVVSKMDALAGEGSEPGAGQGGDAKASAPEAKQNPATTTDAGSDDGNDELFGKDA